jgi:hypothetical protein
MQNQNIPARFERIIDAVCQRDKEFFAQNPQYKSYIRPFVPGETFPQFIKADHTLVTQLMPGVRTRFFITSVGKAVQ